MGLFESNFDIFMKLHSLSEIPHSTTLLICLTLQNDACETQTLPGKPNPNPRCSLKVSPTIFALILFFSTSPTSDFLTIPNGWPNTWNIALTVIPIHNTSAMEVGSDKDEFKTITGTRKLVLKWMKSR